MHSFLIISKNKKTALDFTKSECKKNQIDKFDINILTFQKAIGIEDIRNFQKKIYLKPIKSKAKAIILDSYNGITVSAQNALLKLLEEPPFNTIIYITIQNKNLLLPTILSRCKIVELKDKSYKLSDDESAQYLNILISLPQKTIGEKLRLAQDITRDKGEVSLWLERMILVAREEMINFICHSESFDYAQDKLSRGISRKPLAPSSDWTRDDNVSRQQYLNILMSFQKAHTILSTTNANQRFVLENLFLNF